MHRRDTVRDIGIGVGITLFLFASAIFLPLIGLVSVFLLPMPVLVYRLKLGRAQSAGIAVISLAAMEMVSGSGLIDLFPFLERLILGFVIGESFLRRFSLEKTMLVACGTLLLSGLLVLIFYSYSAGVGIPEFVTAIFDKNFAVITKEFEHSGAGTETMQALAAIVEAVKESLKFLPGIFVSGTLIATWITLLVARPILNRLDLPCPDFTPLIRWRAPKMLVWLLFGCGILSLIHVSWLKLIGLNCLMVVLWVYLFQGIAIMAYFFNKKNVPKVVRWVMYILTTGYTLGILPIGLGLFDIWLNIRKLDIENQQPPSEFKM